MIIQVPLILLVIGASTINAGVTRRFDALLPMRERITRSLEATQPPSILENETTVIDEDKTTTEESPTTPQEEKEATITQQTVEKREKRDTSNSADNLDDLETAANSIVFKPLFRRRQNLRNTNRRNRRAINHDYDEDMDVAESNNIHQDPHHLEDLDTAEKSIVFRPLFASRRRGIKRSRRAANDDLQPAESNIVFRPLFKRRQSNRRFLRDTQRVDDLQTAASHIVFRPLFKHEAEASAPRREQRNVPKRVEEEDEKSIPQGEDQEDQQDEYIDEDGVD